MRAVGITTTELFLSGLFNVYVKSFNIIHKWLGSLWAQDDLLLVSWFWEIKLAKGDSWLLWLSSCYASELAS